MIHERGTETERKGRERRMEYWMEPEQSCLCRSIPATFGFLRISTLQQRFSEKKCICYVLLSIEKTENNLHHVQRLELSDWWFQCEVGEISLTKACRGGYRQICFLAFLIYSRGKRGVLRLFSGTGTLHFNVIISFACDSETISVIFFF